MKDKQTSLTEHGFQPQEPRVKKNPTPMKSLCTECGRQKMLEWKISGKYLCSECKK